MAEEPETTEVDDAPDEAEVVKFLFAVLDADGDVEVESNELRVTAGVKLLEYYNHVRHNTTIERRAAASALAGSIRGTLRRIAMDPGVDISTRIRAAGASL